MSVMRSRREPPILRVPAWKAVGSPVELGKMSSSVGSCMSFCHLGDELLLGVVTGYGRDCQVEVVLRLGGSVCSVGGVGGAWAGE